MGTMRRGLTLLELLLASSMLVVLLGIVWSVTLALSRTETERIQSTEQQRIVRNWTKILSEDFLSVIQDTEQLNKTGGSETIRHFGVSGTTSQLRVDISESSALQKVFYEFHPVSGLVRQKQDYTILESARETMQSAPEIVSGQFRYYDGNTWHEQWTSLERKSAPTAVEVTFYSLPLPEAKRWRNRVSGAAEPVMNRVVVQIPSASQGFSESYQRAHPPQPPRTNPPPPSAPPPPSPPPSDPFRSLFGDG